MKGHLHLGKGKLVVGGEIIAQVPRTVVEIDVDVAVLGNLKGRGEVEAENQTTDEGQTELLNPPSGDSKGGNSASAVDIVWSHYAEVMRPRRKEATDEDRALIRKALKVANGETEQEKAAELCRAIDGCKASEFHMGKNDRQRKYNSLSQILKGRRGRETTRERIDFFLDKWERSDSGIADIPSADNATVMQHVAEVRRGQRLPDDQEVQRTAEQAEEWLKQHGIETVRDANGYPRFRRRGTEGGTGR